MNNLAPNTIFTCRSPSLRGTFRVHHIDGDNVTFSRKEDFLDLWQLSLKSLLKRQAEGDLTVESANG